jgi:formylglycine-generating enzyme
MLKIDNFIECAFKSLFIKNRLVLIIFTLVVNSLIVRSQAPEMIPIYGGTFTMGYTPDQVPGNQANGHHNIPVHIVEIWDYQIAKHEVTQEQYESVMGDNPSLHQHATNLPVENVDFISAIIFCNELSLYEGFSPTDLVYFKDSMMTSPFSLSDYVGLGRSSTAASIPKVYQDHKRLGYRLPTDAEWEYAARGGHLFPPQTRYAGSADRNLVSWNENNSGGITHPVGTLLPNALGIYDMSGNVFERATYDFYLYDKFPRCNPTRKRYDIAFQEDSLSFKNAPARGGACKTPDFYFSISTRRPQVKHLSNDPYKELNGIRLARSVGDNRNCKMDANISVPICNDNNTPFDPSDDMFTFGVQIDKHLGMQKWVATDPLQVHGKYFSQIPMGPYDISAGDLAFVIYDSISTGFQTDTIHIKVPATCSDCPPIVKEKDIVVCNSKEAVEINSIVTNGINGNWINSIGPAKLEINSNRVNIKDKPKGNYQLKYRKFNTVACDSILSEVLIIITDTLKTQIVKSACEK